MRCRPTKTVLLWYRPGLCPTDLHTNLTPQAGRRLLRANITPTGGLQDQTTGPGPPIRLSGSGPVSLSWQDVNCTATSHLSRRRLFLHRAGVRRHIRASKPCFRVAAGLCFKEIHVEARPGDVMAGAGGAAGPALDVRHQPPGRTVYMYFICEYCYINAASKVVTAVGYYE